MDHHPLVEAYLADLDRALAGSDSREHAETMAAIREHLNDVLTPDAAPEQVRRALDELGPVETIAATATRATPSPASEPPGADRLAVGALVAAIASALLLVPLPFIAVPLSCTALIAGVLHLRSTRRSRHLAWTAVVLAAMTLVMTLVLAVTLLATEVRLTSQPAVRVHTAQTAQTVQTAR